MWTSNRLPSRLACKSGQDPLPSTSRARMNSSCCRMTCIRLSFYGLLSVREVDTLTILLADLAQCSGDIWLTSSLDCQPHPHPTQRPTGPEVACCGNPRRMRNLSSTSRPMLTGMALFA
eukprot:4001122-Amphidinium_carterae.1